MALTVHPTVAAVLGGPVLGPARTSIFHDMCVGISYSIPLGIAFLALVGHAVRERSAGLALAAGLVIDLTVTVAYLIPLATSGGGVGPLAWIRLAQLNAVATAAFAMAWMGCRGLLPRPARGMETGPPRNPEKRVYYLTTPDFTNQFTTSIARDKFDFSNGKGGARKLDSFYKSLDVLILNDIQNLEGKLGTQDFMYQIFNSLYNQKKQIIFSRATNQ